ncbi:glycosyltransferase family 2 protein [Oculatella sp. LEGE 06141]|uniref:hormogonium polysaccharide biosynthesis glycosyltransferase HpsN n=1 Tax=Oculatella sp. LEGE 06141 TaxID=1828648 RepID=UPI001882867B|nr:hormogonium polysaccharide biosynthesis glycosyltransferase HpsN [Oculatella sp. LEGE 06141]MBE9178233.1 glycosyltransferase family 2 protein [Oculatella sp. LEGE 06141]
MPLISVIVPTYGREQTLRETLAEVLQQTYPSFEVIVVDQTPVHEPETQAYLEELVQQQAIRLFKLDWASLPGARNYGVRRSVGEVIVFLDDDVQLPAGFLAAHARHYQRQPHIGAVAGRVLDRQKLAEADVGLTIQQLPPEALDPAIGWFHLNLVHTVLPQPVLTARGCNMSFRRALFEQHGLWFDERFRGSAVREESDFCLRMRSTGYTIWYDPEAYLVHLGEETGGCHDISTRSLQYQITFYHNHFWMAFKSLTVSQLLRFAIALFNYQVLGKPPSRKSRALPKILGRVGSYTLGLLRAVGTLIQAIWDDGQVYSRQDQYAAAAVLPLPSVPTASS